VETVLRGVTDYEPRLRFLYISHKHPVKLCVCDLAAICRLYHYRPDRAQNALRQSDGTRSDRERKRSQGVIADAMRCRVVQLAYRRRHPQDIRIARLSGSRPVKSVMRLRRYRTVFG